MNQNEKTDKTFEIKNGKHTYQITELEFNPIEEKIYGKIKLKGTKKKSEFYINFEPNPSNTIYVEDYENNDNEDIYDVIDKFYSDYIEEKISASVENGNFVLTKKMIFK